MAMCAGAGVVLSEVSVRRWLAARSGRSGIG